MEGTAIVYHADGSVNLHGPLKEGPPLKWLREQVKGHIELVPLFQSIKVGGIEHKCIAYCNEEGKLHLMPVNRTATELWDSSIKTINRGSLRDKDGQYLDVLVGSIVVLFGDEEFMEDL